MRIGLVDIDGHAKKKAERGRAMTKNNKTTD